MSATKVPEWLMRRLRRLEWVPRWGVMPTIRKQTVDAHCFHVGVNCLWLLDRHALGRDWGFRAIVLEEVLRHEEYEAVTGDLPSPTKEYVPLKPSDQVQVVLKTADCLEMLQFVYIETLLGNRMGMESIRNERAARLHDYWGLFEWQSDVKKPMTSDLIRKFESFAFDPNSPHPVLEPCQ